VLLFAGLGSGVLGLPGSVIFSLRIFAIADLNRFSGMVFAISTKQTDESLDSQVA